MKLYIFRLVLFSLTGFAAGHFNNTLLKPASLFESRATEKQNNENDESLDDTYESVYNSLDIESIDRNLKRNGINLSVNVEDMIKDITKDDNKGIKEKFKMIIKETFAGEIEDNKNLMIILISVVLLGSIFVNLSGSMGNGFISENGFYITYLIITAIMLTSFMITMELVQDTIRALLIMIKIIIPVYAVAVNFVGHTVTSAAMYEIIMIGIWLVEAVILNIFGLDSFNNVTMSISDNMPEVGMHVLTPQLLGPCFFALAFGAIYYIITWGIMKYRLNLQ